MSQDEDSYEPENSTSTKEEILKFIESIPSNGVHRTSTTTTTRETNDQTFTTEPPFHYSELDEYLCSTEFMEKEVLKKSHKFFSRMVILQIVTILSMSYYTFLLKIISLEIGLPFIVGMTLLFFSLNDFGRK